MKRSKLLIYSGAGLLALAAIAATKRHQADATGYYDFLRNGHCINAAPTACTNTATLIQCTYLWDKGHPGETNFKLYTYNTGPCANQIFYDPD